MTASSVGDGGAVTGAIINYEEKSNQLGSTVAPIIERAHAADAVAGRWLLGCFLGSHSQSEASGRDGINRWEQRSAPVPRSIRFQSEPQLCAEIRWKLFKRRWDGHHAGTATAQPSRGLAACRIWKVLSKSTETIATTGFQWWAVQGSNL